MEALVTLNRFKLGHWIVLLSLCLTPCQTLANTSFAEGRPIFSGADYAPLRSAWSEVQSALSREDWAEAQARLAQLRKVKLDIGLPNLFAVSSVLIRAAERASQTGDDDAALTFTDTARSISPDMALPFFEQATRTIESDVFELPEALKHMRLGYEVLGEDPVATSIFVANMASGLVHLSILLLLLVLGILAARYGGCLVTDVRRMLRGSVDQLQAGVLVLALVLTPMAAGLGLVATAALALLIFALYASRAERIVVVVLLLVTGSLGDVSGLIDRMTSFSSSPEHTIYKCNAGACSHKERSELQMLRTKSDYRYAASYTRALLGLRTNRLSHERLNTARKELEAAWSTEETWQVRVLHGNVAYAQALMYCEGILQGDEKQVERYEQGIEEAKNYWEIAPRKKPDSVEARYNLHVAAQLLGDPEGG